MGSLDFVHRSLTVSNCKAKKRNFVKKIITYAATFLMVLLIKKVICIDITSEIKKHCREKERLITSEELDEYLLVEFEINSTIILQCKFCEDENKEQQQPKIWHWQDRDETLELREVELDMDNNASLNRVYMTLDYSLVIRTIFIEDAGIYRCFGEKGQEQENKYNYRLEPVLPDESIAAPEKGNLSTWEQYRRTNLVPVTLRFSISRMNEFVVIRDAGITLEVFSEWEPWSPCKECIAGHGTKSRRAFCRLKSFRDKTVSKDTDSDIVQFFQSSPVLPCRSRILQERFPSVSSATRHLPEFILTENCKHCKKEKKVKKNKFKYKKRYVLAEGTHLTISCPE